MLILKNKTKHYYIALFRFTNECHITNSNSQFSTSFCLLAAFNKGDQPSFLYQFPFLQLTLLVLLLPHKLLLPASFSIDDSQTCSSSPNLSAEIQTLTHICLIIIEPLLSLPYLHLLLL